MQVTFVAALDVNIKAMSITTIQKIHLGQKKKIIYNID